MTILFQPYSKKLRNGNRNAKDYPYPTELFLELERKGINVIQIGITGEKQAAMDFRINLSTPDVVSLIKSTDSYISVDSFLPHAAHYYGKKGCVIFSQSNPENFGYPENLNLLKDKKYLREHQFNMWEECPYLEEAFMSPEEVVNHFLNWLKL